MGYDVHITRAEDWVDSEETPIPLDEWLAYIDRDTEMRHDGKAIAEVDHGVLEYVNPGLAVWTAYTGHAQDGNMAWFDHRNGHIVVKNPDEEILGKMKRIAIELDARVIGDEGEEY